MIIVNNSSKSSIGGIHGTTYVESEMSLKRAISEAIECDVKYDESPLYGCDVSVKEVED